MSVWAQLVYALAIARVAGLITDDMISRPVRDWVVAHLPPWPVSVSVETLLTCTWCASIWVAAAVVPLAWHWGDRAWLVVPALVLAASQVAGMTSTLGRPAQPSNDLSLETSRPRTDDVRPEVVP